MALGRRSQRALNTLLDPGMHGQQLVSIVACRNVREWLEKDDRRKVVFHWCPSHKGVEWNELVDDDAKQAADLPVQRDECSLAHAHHLLAVQLKSDWRNEYRSSPAYSGRNFLRLAVFDPPSHTSSPALQMFGDSKSSMARFCRAVLDHAPLGSFRRRFFPDEPVDCPECKVFQDRRHVLLRCRKYRRWWNCRSEYEFLMRLSSYRDVKAFLEANESAFTFADAPS